MENRRQTYRHAFDPEESVSVELRVPGLRGPLACELIDLSLGGMLVRLRPMPLPLHAGDRLVAQLLGRSGPSPVELSLALPCSVTHLERSGDGTTACGIAFLQTANPGTNENIDRTLGRFLMAEQRRVQRRRLHTDEDESI